MDIEIWDGGLQEQEIEAINKIKAAFADTLPGKFKGGGNSLRDQLQNKLGRPQNQPWKGYAGFRFVDSKGKEGEFDLVIATHCNVIIVELKDWNHEPVTANGDVWFKGDKNMGRSPVSVTRNKKFLLDNKLKRLSSRFTNKKYPVSLPIGFISANKDVVSSVGRLVTTYLEGSSGFERPKDCGLLSRFGRNE